MQRLWEQVKGIASRYNTQQKLVLVITVLVLVAGVIGVAMYAGRTRYGMLYGNLEGKDASAVTEKLDELKVDYKISGTSILVPADKVDSTRVQLAGAGIPSGGKVGFEIFDNTSFGASDFSRQVNYQRALEGELSRTISAMETVDNAIVHLALPEDEIFSDESQEATASVMLKLEAGGSISSGQVQSITNLVAGAVKGLEPEKVSVTDAEGNPLSSSEAASAMTSEQLRSLKAYEGQMEASLQSILDRVVGRDKGLVRVHAELDFSSKTGQVETFSSPTATGLPEASSASQETYSNAGGATAGVPGTTSNIPGYTTITGDQNGGTYNKTETSTTYDNNHTIEEVKTPPGRVVRTSTAVLLDNGVDRGAILGLENALTAAAGVDVARGDVLTVEVVPFDKLAGKQAEKEISSARMKNMISTGLKTFGLVALAVLALILLRKRLKNVKARLSALPVTAGPSTKAMDAVLSKAQPLLDGRAKAPMLGSIELLAAQKPDEVAQVLKAMMKERA